MWSLLLSTIVICVSFISALDDHVVVQTKSGPVRGKSFNTLFDNKPYYSFRGIPFAEEPVNELRFKVSSECYSEYPESRRNGEGFKRTFWL